MAHRQKSALPRLKHTVAITGSVGKTTTKEFLRTIVSPRYRTHATAGNMNNEIGLPLTVLTSPDDCEFLILECGMNHTGEISRLSLSANPDIAIITNIGTSHIGNLGSREKIAEAKLEILDGMPSGGILLCEHGEPLLRCADQRVTFSDTDKLADYAVLPSKDELRLMIRGIYQCNLDFKGGRQLIPDLAAAVAAADLIGLSADDIADGVKMIGEGELRYRLIRRSGYTLLDDSYNSSYESATSALKHLMTLSAPVHSALLGDILELGTHAEEIHRALGRYAAGANLDKLYLVGKYAHHLMSGAVNAGMKREKIFILDSDNLEEIALIIKSGLSEGECMLIKASHATELWRIPKLLDGEDND